MTYFDQFVAYYLTRILSNRTIGNMSKPEAEKALKVFHEMSLNPDISVCEERAILRARARRAAWENFQKVLNLGRTFNALKENNPNMELWLLSQGCSREEFELATELAEKLSSEQNLDDE